jgi:hypothetical protein
MAVERWRLQEAYPEEMELARRPILDLVQREIDAATEAGLMDPPNPANAAWLVSELMTAVHYRHAFMPAKEPVEQVIDELWTFCLAGLRGTGQPAGTSRASARRSAGPRKPAGTAAHPPRAAG